MNIYVSINTNHNLGETKIDYEAIHDFTTNGFMEGTYDADVTFRCLPAAVDANELKVIIEAVKDIADYGQAICFYGSICRAIYSFLKKCKGYNKTVEIEGCAEIPEIIDVSEEMSEEEFEAKVLVALRAEQKNTRRNVEQIMRNNNE